MAEYTICIALIVFALACSSDLNKTALSQGSFGREFYIGVLKPYRIDMNEDVTLIISSAKNSSGRVNVHAPVLGIDKSFASSPTLEVSISNSIIQSTNKQVEHNGIHVTSDVDISVLVITSINGVYKDSRETFLALPTTLLSSSYIISTYESQSWNSEFLVVATENNTIVNITNSKTGHLAQLVNMNCMDTYLFESSQDLSGTIVSSNKPIAVFSGNEAAGVACTHNHYIVEQLLPTKFFDREFIVPPLPPKSAYVVRVFGIQPNTTINYTLNGRNGSRVLVSSEGFQEILSNNKPIVIYSDKPTQVMLYSTCHTFDSESLGGSTMSIIPSTRQYYNMYHFNTPLILGDARHYLAIMAKNINIESGLRMDGRKMYSKVNAYNVTTFGATYFVYIYQVYTGSHKLEQIDGTTFGALMYGYGRNQNYLAYSNIIGLNIAGCDGLSSPINGKVTMPDGTKYLSQALYSCMKGYSLLGSPTRTCNISGQWSGVMPTCEAIDCGRLVSPINGDIRTHNGTKYGNQAEYFCNQGYTLHGQSTRTCDGTGQWTGINPTCEPVDCGPPVSLINGYVNASNGTSYGHDAEYICNQGYILKGERIRKCNASGHWSGTAPICEKFDVSLTCLKCTDVYHTNLCSTVTKCPQGQVCFVEKFTTHNGEVRYNSGCMESKQCDIAPRAVGKRSVDCIECCSSDLCNFAGCESPGLPPRNQRGPLCYDCAFTYNMSECKAISLCKPYEVCSIDKYDWGGLFDKYTTECKAAHCLSSNSASSHSRLLSRSTPVCQQCCEKDLCNSYCNVTSNTGNGVSIVG